MTTYTISLHGRNPLSRADIDGTVDIPECGVRCAFHSFAQLKVILLAVQSAGGAKAKSITRYHEGGTRCRPKQ